MSAQDNVNLARRIYQMFNQGQFEPVLDLVTEDVTAVLMPMRQAFQGKEGFREFMLGFKDGFPDMSITVTHQVADNDSVVSEFTVKGTHTGTLRSPQGDIPATGRKIEYPVVEVWQIRDGKLATLRNYFDVATLMGQLGLPLDEQAGRRAA